MKPKTQHWLLRVFLAGSLLSTTVSALAQDRTGFYMEAFLSWENGGRHAIYLDYYPEDDEEEYIPSGWTLTRGNPESVTGRGGSGDYEIGVTPGGGGSGPPRAVLWVNITLDQDARINGRRYPAGSTFSQVQSWQEWPEEDDPYIEIAIKLLGPAAELPSLSWEAIEGWDNVELNYSPVPWRYRVTVAANYETDPWLSELPGGGYRIFPDAASHQAGSPPRSYAYLAVRGSPRQWYHAEIFDVDDPTPPEFDEQGEIDRNGPAGDDNLDWEPGHPRRGELYVDGTWKGRKASIQTDADGLARIVVGTSRQPGDNFRVAVTPFQEDLSRLQVVDPNARGFVPAGSDQSQVEGFRGSLSPLLTVWRYLNIEVDTMVAPGEEAWPDKGTTANALFRWNYTEARGGRWVLNLLWSDPAKMPDPPPENYFQGGTIRNEAGEELETMYSAGIRSFHIELGIAEERLRQDFSSRPLTISDDDGRFMPPEYHLPRSGESIITPAVIAKFIPAYIQLRVVPEGEGQLNAKRELRFRSHDGNKGLSELDDRQEAPDRPDWWGHLVVAAHQRNKRDGDPQTEWDAAPEKAPDLGVTWTSRWRWIQGDVHYSVLFLETIRDFWHGKHAELSEGWPHLAQAFQLSDPERREFYQKQVTNNLQAVTAHEIAHAPPHLPGMPDHHEEGGLQNSNLITNYFTPLTIYRHRITTHWWGRTKDQTRQGQRR